MEMSLTMMLSVITLILTFSSLLETTQSRMFRQPRTTNVLLSSGREHDAVYRPSPSPPPPPRSAPPSHNWYGRDSPKSPPPPTAANTPGRQIDGNQYVAATGGYRGPASAGPPAVISLTFSRTSLHEPQLDESS